MVVLVGTLTGRAAICCRIGLHSLTLDGLTTTYTDTIRAQRDTLQRVLDRADLLHIPGDLRQVDVDEKVRKGLILEIADAAGYVGIAFVVGPRERLTCLLPQFGPAVPQLVLEV